MIGNNREWPATTNDVAELREEMRSEIRRLHRELVLTRQRIRRLEAAAEGKPAEEPGPAE